MSARRIVRRPMAEDDAVEIAVQIAAANSRSAARFTKALRATEESLLAMPGMGSSTAFAHPLLVGMRFHLVRGFRKYLIFYIPRDDGIEVVRVLHGSRDLETLFGAQHG